MKFINLLEQSKKRGTIRIPGVDTGESVSISGTKYAIHMDPHDHKSGYHLVFVNDKFEKHFSQNESFYVGANGVGGIGKRYEKLGEWLQEAEYITVPDVYIAPNGSIMFGNGRHRYAWMRDHGVSDIPVAMDADSTKRAKEMGFIDHEIAITEDLIPALIGISTFIKEVGRYISILTSSSNRKNQLNDKTLNSIYQDERTKVFALIGRLPAKISDPINKQLNKLGIKSGGVDLSREYLKRIIIIKFLRLFLHTVENALQDPTTAVIALVSNWLSVLISVIFNLQDLKSFIVAIKNEWGQMKKVIEKINNDQSNGS